MPPADNANSFEWLLFQQDDVVTWKQARSHLSAGALKWRRRTGRWQSPHRSICVAHSGPITANQRLWIASLAVGNGRPAPLAGLTALSRHGLRGYASSAIHTLIPARSKETNRPSGVVVHRTTIFRPTDLQLGNPPLTRPARSVLDAASWATDDDRARAIVAAAFQQRVVTEPAINEVLSRMKRAKRRALVAETARDAAGGSESISEHDFLRLCRHGGLPAPARQTVVEDNKGRRRYRDAYFEEWQLHVEIDGGQHMDIGNWWADMKSQNEMWIAGDRVLRFPAWAVRHEPEAVIVMIRQALQAAGWRGETR
jgi:very-short-patch-repair endonuclease